MPNGDRRAVQLSSDFQREARDLFPQTATAEGRPNYRHFLEGPLAAAIEAFSREFEAIPETPVGSGIRVLVLSPSNFFAPLAIYGVLVGDCKDVHVELVSVIEDDSYWQMIEGDPVD